MGSGNSRNCRRQGSFGSAGNHSSWDNFDNLLGRDPEKIIMMPCGFSIQKTQKEMEALKVNSRWAKLKAFKNKNIFIVDGNQYFNRPGPRILDSIKILIEIISGGKNYFGYKEKAWKKFTWLISMYIIFHLVIFNG